MSAGMYRIGTATTTLSVEGFLIDMDGVLLDTERLSQDCWREAERISGQRLPETVRSGVVGLSLQRIHELFAEEMPASFDRRGFLEIANRCYRKAVHEGVVPLKAGAAAFLKRLAELEAPRCLVTSTQAELAKDKLRSVGLLQYLPLRVGGDDVQRSKPDPEPYRRGAERLGLTPARCCALEDSANGLTSALAAGCQVLHLPDICRVQGGILERVALVAPSLEDVVVERVGSDAHDGLE
jgi:HAD superfamily hydrolase (TIGR01509 family)